MVLISAAILGFWAGASLVAWQQCANNPSPSYCRNLNDYPYNGTTATAYYYWSFGYGYGPSVVVNTGAGKVRGQIWASRSGRRFSAFLGIPYAEIPRRFEDSIPYGRWEGTKDALNYGNMCFQIDRRSGLIMGSEDCLFLNIFTPQCYSGALLPVMVWIDSSLGWGVGSGDKINPRNFMDENVLLLTFNFRLSALGFLSTTDGEIQGNMGLKDQVLALNWVKQNIRNFGGDPDRITIFGQDSGAAAVNLHMLSPLSKGLFHRAISQGGSALCPWALQRNPLAKAKLLAQTLNCETTSSKVMADCLRFKSGFEIVQAEAKIKRMNWNGLEPYGNFAPVVEPPTTAYKSPSFLPNTPRKILSEKVIPSPVPWIVGLNEQEGRYFVTTVLNSENLLSELNSKWNEVAPLSFLYDDDVVTGLTKGSRDALSSKIKGFYFSSSSKKVGRENWENYTNIYTDRWYLAGVTEAVRLHSGLQGQGGQVFPYLFKFKGDFSYTPAITGDYTFKHAPSHYDELHYLFNWEWSMTPNSTTTTTTTASENLYQEFSKKFIKLWVSFAETGVPRGWGSTPNWNAMSPLNSFVPWYNIDYDTHLQTATEDVYKQRLDFWKPSNTGLHDDT